MFIVKELCQRMSSPNQQSLPKLKRLVRYLKRERQWGHIFGYGRLVEQVTTLTGRLQVNLKVIKRRRDTMPPETNSNDFGGFWN